MKKYYKLAFDFHPQEEWASAPMWLEMSFGAIGGGLFIFSALRDYVPGIIVGFLILMVGKGGFLLAELRKPERFLYMFKRPFKSWISFGALAFVSYGVIGLIYGITVLIGAPSFLLKIVAIFLGLILIVYDGFFLSASTGVAAWHSSSMLPGLFGVSALGAGAALALAFDVAIPPYVAFILFAALLFAHFTYVNGLASSVQAAKVSAAKLVSGQLRIMYIWIAIGVGAVIPLVISLLAMTGAVSISLWLVVAICAVVGIFALRYSILKAGVYAPEL